MTLFAGLLLTLSTGLGYSHPGYGAAAILESEPVHLEASVLSIEKNDGGSGIGGNLLAEVKLGWVWIGGEWTRQSVEHYSSGEVLPRVRIGTDRFGFYAEWGGHKVERVVGITGSTAGKWRVSFAVEDVQHTAGHGLRAAVGVARRF